MIREFKFLTAERLQMHKWRRKKRMKFRKRWRKQHGGAKFYWTVGEFRYAHLPIEPGNMIFFVRQPHDKSTLENTTIA